MNPLDFSGQAVAVTGGSGGIGNAIARAFRDVGAEVTVTGTREAGDYDADLAGMRYCRLDLGDDDAIAAFCADIERLDVLVNAAGAVFYRGREFEAETFRKVMDVNLTAVLQLSTGLRDRLSAAPGGNIVNISSLTGYFSSRGNPAYGASKAALVQLTKSLAVAWARDDIRVNAIAPGWVKTKMTEVSWSNEEIDHAIIRRTPLGRWAAPEEIAGPALFLASPLASYVTGETLLVDGGFSLVI
jgi:3-oxoacyl-[acyl-carrier protein] reductase